MKYTQLMSSKWTITPAVAKDLLENNENNRPLKPKRIARYADDMVNGRWTFNGESIKVDQAGNLLDGQNRLHAIIKAGASVDMMVTVGIPRQKHVFETIDCGANRSAGDALRLEGVAYAKDIPAIVRIYVASTKGNIETSSNASITEFVGMHQPLLAESAQAGAEMGGIVYKSVYGAFYFRMLMEGNLAVRDFHRSLVTMEGLKAGSPILALRKALEKSGKDRGSVKKQINIAKCTKAFQAWEKDISMTRIRGIDALLKTA